MHDADSRTRFLSDDIWITIARLHRRVRALLIRVLAVQHVSDSWMEQHQRDAAKH